MANQPLINKVFKAMMPITNVIESEINKMDRHLQVLPAHQKHLYLLSIVKKTQKLNETIMKFAKELKPHRSKRRHTMKGGMHRGHQIVRHQSRARPQQLAHKYDGHQRRHAQNLTRRRNESRRQPKFNQWAANPAYVTGGGIALGLIIYKLILPLIFKKAPGAVARVTGKLAEAVAIQLANGISWTSAKTSSAIEPLVSFFDFSVKEVYFYQPGLKNSQGHPIPTYVLPEGVKTLPPPRTMLGYNIPILDPSSQFTRVYPAAYVPPTVDPPVVKYLSNSVRNVNLSRTFGNGVEWLLESAVDDETKTIFFILSILGGIMLTGGVLILLDRHRLGMNLMLLNAEQREANLEETADLNTARLEGQLAAYQQLLGLQGNPVVPMLQGIQAGVQLSNPAPALVTSGQPVQPVQPHINEQLNDVPDNISVD